MIDQTNEELQNIKAQQKYDEHMFLEKIKLEQA